jgi:alpha-L-arabinofuranosidase
MKKTLLTALAATAFAVTVQAQKHELTIEMKRNGAPIQKTMYGLFIEDINYAADGGLYAELVKNRSFDFPYAFTGWKVAGNVEVRNDGPFDRNPNYVRLHSSGHGHKWTALLNEGFFGIGVEKDKEYRFSFYARVPEGKDKARIRMELAIPVTNREGQDFLSHEMDITGSEWKQYEVVVKSPLTEPKAELRVFLLGNNAVDLEHISLFPVDTWKGRKGGLRKDLMEALAEMKPGCFRFPGGCIVEGTDLASRYNWKNTLGPVENRPLNENRWHYTFRYRFFPDYFQSYGLGFYEYFLLSEEIGAEPLPVLNVGLACEFQNGSHRSHAHVPVDQLQPYIDDVLDLIEFANGDPEKNMWAKLRADMGHPEPFNLKYVGIGNEQWGEIYPENLKPFVEQVRAKYPHIQIIGSSGPNSEGADFEYLWPEMRKLGADLVDEHFYRPETWFLASGPRYDNYQRKGPKVFAGEYACHGRGKKWNHFNASLLEAAFLTGVERNADIVTMATYAPLFAHIDGWQWRPDMIWFDNLRSFRSCSWYFHQIYAHNKGTNVLKLTWNGKPVAGTEGQEGLFASSVFDKNTNEVIVKIVNTGEKTQNISVNLNGLKKGTHAGSLTTYSSDNLDGENTLDNPTKYVPQTKEITVEGTTINVNIAPKSFAMYKIKK